MPAGPPEVYSLDEIARAAYVDQTAVQALVARGRLRLIPGTGFAAEADAMAAARVLRHSALLSSRPVSHDLFTLAARGPGAMPRPGGWSMAVHLTVMVVIVALGRAAAPASATTASSPASHLVFLVEPGPGGGGGGGGARVPQPAARMLEPAKAHPSDAVSVPETVAPRAPALEPEPIPVKPLAAPLAPVAAAIDRHQGEIGAVGTVASAGRGADGAGTGRDGGNGPGRGSGVGEGEDHGFGGGPYRPGSGVEPPRLLREVKATYSEEARRANVVGDVVMEVVVRADGSVASARVLRGLGFGLDERAVAAVYQWRFAPARRAGAPVDVAVEVAMEFNLR